MKIKLHIFFIVALIIIGFSFDAGAQCAMCKATAESASDNIDQSIGEGLNNGILYLMGIPYLLLISSALLFFRKPLIKFYRELAHH